VQRFRRPPECEHASPCVSTVKGGRRYECTDNEAAPNGNEGASLFRRCSRGMPHFRCHATAMMRGNLQTLAVIFKHSAQPVPRTARFFSCDSRVGCDANHWDILVELSPRNVATRMSWAALGPRAIAHG
jgi:hypothetical protein